MIFKQGRIGYSSVLGVCLEPARRRRREAREREALGLDEIGNKGLSRGFQKIDKRALLNDVAGAQKDEMIAQVCGFAQVMSDQDHGLVGVAERCS